jgi:hypothetical protein
MIAENMILDIRGTFRWSLVNSTKHRGGTAMLGNMSEGQWISRPIDTTHRTKNHRKGFMMIYQTAHTSNRGHSHNLLELFHMPPTMSVS